MFLRPTDRLFPLKTGDELFVDAPDAEVNQQIQFTFEVAFGAPGIVEGEALVETVQHMADLVTRIIASFESLVR